MGLLPRRSVLSAATCAVLVLMVQVGGKAARDAILLARHPVTTLPVLVIVAAVLSFCGAVGFARLMTRFGPGRVVPLANVVSAALLALEWLLDGAAPRAISIAVYIHLSVSGGLLVSGFWSLVSERFDPRAARRHVSLIGGAATTGGLLGGLLVERLGAMVPGVTAILPVLVAIQLLLAWLLAALARSSPATAREPDEGAPLTRAWRTLRASPQLARLSLLVLVGGAAAAILDFAFKAGAAQAHQGESLLRFFALYYAVTGVATVAVQALLGRLFVDRAGPAASLATAPAAIVLFGAGAALFPGAFARVVARGAENVFRNSIYRAGYELLFAPLPERDKRATKTLIDVAVDRLGDIAGGIILSAALAIGVASERTLLLASVALALAALGVVVTLHRGQLAALAQSLRTRAQGTSAESAVSMAILSTVLPPAASGNPAIPLALRLSGRTPVDPIALAATALHSGEATRVIRVLRDHQPLPAALVPHVIPLLGWDDVAAAANNALAAVAPRITGQLVDHLLDPDEEFAVRRRLPPIIEQGETTLAAWALLAAQRDERFEVRFRCGRALQRLVRRQPGLPLDTERLLDAVRREVQVERTVWESRRLLDLADADEHEGDRTLQHVFRLISLAFPDEPLAIAFRGVARGDAHLRGTALEFLEKVLPADLRDALWPILEPPRLARGTR